MTQAETGKRAAIYARTPPVQEAGATIALAEQIHQCKEYCQRHSYTPLYVYAEVGSANNTDRKSLVTALADARAGKFAVLVIHDFFRLARNGDLLQSLISQFEQAGVTVASVSEGEQLAAMIAAIYEEVSRISRERMAVRSRAGRQPTTRERSVRP